jgi:hypothetical protein
MDQHDLLIDEDCLVFAVNCQEEGSTLHCGALYLEPLIPNQLIRLAYEGVRIQVELPQEFINAPTPYRAWDVELQICDEQVRIASLQS